MMGHRLHVWRLERVRPRTAAVLEGHLRVPRGRPVPTRRTSDCSCSRRSATSRASTTSMARSSGCRSSSRCSSHVFETIRAFQARRPLSRRLLWNRVLLHVWPVMEPSPDALRRLIERLVAADRRPRDRGRPAPGSLARADGEVRRARAAVLPPDAARGRGRGRRSADRADPARSTRAPGGSSPPAGAACCTRRDRQAARPCPAPRPGSPRRVRRARADATRSARARRPATGDEPERDRRRHDPQLHRALSGGDAARDPARRSDPRARLARRARVPADHRRDRPRRAAWRAARVVRALGGRQDRDGQRHGDDGLDRGVVRRIVLFTQAGGEINVVVAGINVGAQPYWNAEATMLMHTRGALIMTPDSAMVLTGKQSLDYSGGVSAEDNFGIGGYERIMGPNGQAQYWARDLAAACRLLLSYYEHTYVAPGRALPAARRAPSDPAGRDVGDAEHHDPGSGSGARRRTSSPTRRIPAARRPFDIRSVMRAVIDSDHAPLERWARMHAAEIGVVWDAHLGGLAGVADRNRVTSRCPATGRCRPTDRRSGRRHAVPALGQEDRARDQRGRRAAAGRRARQPRRLRRLARVDARDCSSSSAPRSGARSSTSTDRSCSA